jgi:hypothetical protein
MPKKACLTSTNVLVAGLFILLLAGCQPSGYTYVRNSEDGAYVKFPSNWHLFKPEDVIGRQAQQNDLTPGLAEELAQEQWAVAFDADPQPSLDHLFVEPDGHVIGLMRVRQLSESERDEFSLSHLRNEFIQIDEIMQAGIATIEPLEMNELTTPEGMRGVRLRFDLGAPTGQVFTYEQIAYVDAATEKVYLLALGCTADCFKATQTQIEQITESWTIKEPTL